MPKDKYALSGPQTMLRMRQIDDKGEETANPQTFPQGTAEIWIETLNKNTKGLIMEIYRKVP